RGLPPRRPVTQFENEGHAGPLDVVTPQVAVEVLDDYWRAIQFLDRYLELPFMPFKTSCWDCVSHAFGSWEEFLASSEPQLHMGGEARGLEIRAAEGALV
ncbi:hypothetical protein E4U51_001001, partial [Claviceps purpurea]